MPIITLMDFVNSSFDSSFAPADLNTIIFSFSRSTILSPAAQRFKKYWEVAISFLSRILQIWSMFFLFDNLSCSVINSYISKIMSIQSLIVEMKSERCLFWKVFWKSSFFGQRSNTHHAINIVLQLSCILKTEIDPL